VSEQPRDPSGHRYRTYWLSRNRLDGELSNKIDIWLTPPERLRFADGDVQWVVLGELRHVAHYGRWTLEQAEHEVGPGVPDTDRELLRVGDETTIVPVNLAAQVTA
jgi:hypothetical protein